MERILIVNVNWLGDAVLTTPVFKALKEHYPSSYLACMCVERVREVFESNPYINEVIVFDEKSTHKSIMSKLRFILHLRKKRFDKAFFIHRSFTRVLICFLAGIKERTGYARIKNFFVINNRVKKPLNLVHRQEHYLYLFEAQGVVFKDKTPRFFIKEDIRDAIKKTLEPITKHHAFIIGINPSANWVLKRWPSGNFAKLADRLIKENNAAILFVGANKDSAVVDEVIGKMEEKPYNFCGKTSIAELGALMSHMNIFISNDSGPAHLAASLGVNTLVIFGPTSAKVTSPLGRSVSIIKKDSGCNIPCYNSECLENVCLTQLTSSEVYDEVKNILSK